MKTDNHDELLLRAQAQTSAIVVRWLVSLTRVGAVVLLVGLFVACGPSSQPQEIASSPQPESAPPTQALEPQVPGPFDSFEDPEEDISKAEELVAKGQFDEALTLLEKAVAIDPENEEIHYRLGFCLSRLNRPADAIKHYQKTIEIFHEYPEAHNNLGNLLMRQGNQSAAQSHFRTAIELAPDLASAHNNLGSSLSREAKVNQAVPHFVAAVELNPAYVEARCNLGNAYLVLGRAQEAAQEFTRALRLREGFTPALRGLHRARVKLGANPLP